MRKVLSVLALSLGMVAGGVQADAQTAQKLRGMGVNLTPEVWTDVEAAAWDDHGNLGMVALLVRLVAWGDLPEEAGVQLCSEQGSAVVDEFRGLLVIARESALKKDEPIEEASKQ